MGEVVNLIEAASRTGVSQKTLSALLHERLRQDPPPRSHKLPSRVGPQEWHIDLEELEALLAERKAHLLRSRGEALPRPSRRDLETRVAALEEQLATLHRQAPWSFEPATPSRVASAMAPERVGDDQQAASARDSNDLPRGSLSGTPGSLPKPSRPRARQRSSTQPLPLPGPPLPDGWYSFNGWCNDHGVNHRAAHQMIDSGNMPRPERGEWWERAQGPTRSAYTREQHITAARYAAVRWPARFTPCDVCKSHFSQPVTIAPRELQPTVPMRGRHSGSPD